MMPVIRLSDATWDRLKSYAKPFEDKPEDIVMMALNALDEKMGRVSRRPETPQAAPQSPPTATPRRSAGKKLPQKEFRVPLIKTLLELGGQADVSQIRLLMKDKMAPLLSPADYEPVSTGDPRWWNAICWARNDLVKEGLIVKDSERGVWKLSALGKAFLR